MEGKEGESRQPWGRGGEDIGKGQKHSREGEWGLKRRELGRM